MCSLITFRWIMHLYSYLLLQMDYVESTLTRQSFSIVLDGTTNFAHGYPSFAVSVGVLFQGNPAAAAVVMIRQIALRHDIHVLLYPTCSFVYNVKFSCLKFFG